MNTQAFRVGELCDQYEIVSLLAVGGSGEVYRAVQRSMDRTVALKCLQFRHVARADLKARMEMESRALGRINHPNVVTVYDAGCTDDGVVWIAMELLVGQTMREVLQERWRLPLTEAVSCAIDVAEGVGAAHEQQIIHRDIKPENVFLTERGVTKVLDLGTAKIHGWGKQKTTDRGRVIGTPAYMAPEHIRCVGVDERTDVYAVGLLLYEMLAGHPFAHMADLDDYQEIARLQLHGIPRPLTEVVRGVPETVSQVVLRALRKDPTHRPQSMPELVLELRDATGIPAPVRHVTPSLPPAREVQPPFAHLAPLAPSGPSGPSGPLGPKGTLRLPQLDMPAAEQPKIPAPTPDGSWTVRTDSDYPQPDERLDRRPGWLGSALLVGLFLGIAGGSAVIWLTTKPAVPESTTTTESEPTTQAVHAPDPVSHPDPVIEVVIEPDVSVPPSAAGATVATVATAAPPPSTTRASADPAPAKDAPPTPTDADRFHPDPVLPVLPRSTKTAAPASEPPRKMPSSGL